MIHTAALVSSLASLGLICAIYHCNIRSPRDSWLRTEVLGSILLSLLTGLFPIALAGSLVGLWAVIAGNVSMSAILAAGADLLSLGIVFATVWVIRVTLKAIYAQPSAPTNVTPFMPRPVGQGASAQTMKEAA